MMILLLTALVINSAVALSSLPLLPESPQAMIRQAVSAITSASKADDEDDDAMPINRQTIRLALSESMYSSKEESFVADRAIGWQGGPQETYRYLLPLTQQLLREISAKDDNTSGLSPKVQEQILLDFDGSSMLSAESPMGPKYDSIALIQPNTDQYYANLIQQMEDTFSDTPGKAKRLFLIVNPSWKEASSWGFFQAKQAQTNILDRYPVTYALDQFIIKGLKISLLKCWPHDWCVYWTPLPQPGSSSRNSDRNITEAKLLGHFQARPEYMTVEKLILEAAFQK